MAQEPDPVSGLLAASEPDRRASGDIDELRLSPDGQNMAAIGRGADPSTADAAEDPPAGTVDVAHHKAASVL